MTSPHIFILLFLLALSSATGLRAQETDSRVDNYLSAIEAKKGQSSPINNHFRAWLWAILGDEQKAYDAFCETETDACDIQSIKNKDGAIDIDTFLSAASQADIFILNEAHHASRHRAFATTLLLA